MKDASRSNWERALLVCGKCSRKVGGGFGEKGQITLAKVLRREPGFGKGREARVGVAEVKCLGVCPKHAVTVIDTRDLGRWCLVRPGDDAAVRALVSKPERAGVELTVSETILLVADPDQPPA